MALAFGMGLPDNFLESIEIGDNDGRRIFVILAIHYALLYQGTLFQFGLDGLGCDILAVVEFEHLLLAVGDLQETAIYQAADIAGMQPPLFINYLAGLLRVLVVAHHHVRAAGEDLAIVQELDFCSVDGLAHGADNHEFVNGVVHSDNGGGFRHSVPLAKLDAGSGEAALQQTLSVPYDLILMDQRMPGMDGTEALERIRALEEGLNKDTPVICLTADAIRGAKERYISEGFNDYLTKPVEGIALEKMLIKYLPEDKVVRVEPGTPEATADTAKDETGDEELFLALRRAGVDTNKALLYCQWDPAMYKSVLADYLTEAGNRRAKLRECYDDKDWKDYTIYAHSLKSSSKMIGAGELSNLAAGLEKAGDRGDEAVILRDHDRTMELYDEMTAIIGRYLKAEEKPEGADGGFEVLEFAPQGSDAPSEA